MFIGLLTALVNESNHTKCISLSNHKCKIHLSFINLYLNEYSQEFHYNPFAVKLYRCLGSNNTLNDSSHKLCVPNLTGDLNLSMFNMITRINESKTLIKLISCEWKCKFDERKCNLNQWWNNNKCQCECNKRYVCGAAVYWLSLLHNFLQQSLNSDSAHVQTLLVACRRFAMVRISDNGLGWK